MKTIKTTTGKNYAVTSPEECTVTTPEGVLIATCQPGQQTTFVAPTDSCLISTDAAHVTECFKGASLTVPRGGAEIREHIADNERHLSIAEKSLLNYLTADYGTREPTLPEGALPWAHIYEHFARNAQPGLMSAPSAVYVSRVPWARWDATATPAQWVNNASEVDEQIFGVPRKFMDNTGLRHKCSTDTEEGEDDYNGHLWPFYWQHANFVTDEYGVKHITAIKGTPEFTTENNVGAFGPAFWFFCKTESCCDPVSGQWYTHDGTESGTPLYQLWGISTRVWEELDETRQAELAAHGIGPEDLHLWPECLGWDAAAGAEVPRPYWLHSAYFASTETDAAGNTIAVSKPDNWPLLLGDYQHINNQSGFRPGFGGGAAVHGFGMLFDIVKNATKNSQSIHMGNCWHYTGRNMPTFSITTPGYLFPIGRTGQKPDADGAMNRMDRGSTVRLEPTKKEIRIEQISLCNIMTADGLVENIACIEFNPADIEPFVTCSAEDVNTAVEQAQILTDNGQNAYGAVNLVYAMPGSTNKVIGTHDGSFYSYSTGRTPYRVQGTEYSPGSGYIASDILLYKSDGATELSIEGESRVPTLNEYIVLQAPLTASRPFNSSTLPQLLESGWVPIGTVPRPYTTSGFVLNCRLTPSGVSLPVDMGGTGSSSTTGHADYSEHNNDATTMRSLIFGANGDARLREGSAASAYGNGIKYSTCCLRI